MGISNYSISSRSYSLNNIYYIEYIKSISHENKYTQWYINIISNSLNRYNFDQSVKKEQNRRNAKKLLGYVEFHHIVPKSIQNTFDNDLNNLVALTPKEHFICHLLLTKMLVLKENANKMIFAFKQMRASNNEKRYISKYYSRLKVNTPPTNLGKIYITNGVDTVYHYKHLAIPQGWKKGTGLKYRLAQQQSNDKNRKKLIVVDIISNKKYLINNVGEWSKKEKIPYSTITSAIKNKNILRKKYKVYWKN